MIPPNVRKLSFYVTHSTIPSTYRVIGRDYSEDDKVVYEQMLSNDNPYVIVNLNNDWQRVLREYKFVFSRFAVLPSQVVIEFIRER